MKTTGLLVLMATLTSPVAAQVGSACDSPAFAASFRARFAEEVKNRQALGVRSEAELSRRIASIMGALKQSGLFTADDLKAQVDKAANQSLGLTKDQRSSLSPMEVFRHSVDVIPIAVGNDPIKQTRAYCLLGFNAFVDLAKARARSEAISAATQQGLLQLAASKGYKVPEEAVKLATEPAISCRSPDGELAARERVEMHFEGLREQERTTQSRLDAELKTHIAAKGWDEQRVAAVVGRVLALPPFVALEEEMRPVARELLEWMQAGPRGGSGRPDACSWPDRLIGLMERISDLNQRQYALMSRELKSSK